MEGWNMARPKADASAITQFVETPDVDAERLRRELAAKELELETLRSEMAARDAATQPLPDSGAGLYRVTCRHTVCKLKRWTGVASNERDAWSQYQQAAIKAAYNQKDPAQRAVKAAEAFFRHGTVHGFDRVIEKTLGKDAKDKSVFPSDLRLEAHKAQAHAGRAWKEALIEKVGEVGELAEV
jgi:hypothetical protein